MNKLMLALPLMMIVCSSYAQIYKWTDSQGVIHFSDNPHQGSETVKLPEPQTYSPPASANTNAPSAKPENKPSEDTDHQYTKISITQPTNESTIRNNQGYVVVTVQVEPELFSGDKLQLIFDGSPIGEAQPSTLFQLNGIYRGTHTIAVQALNEKDEVVNTSEPITIYMQRPRVGMVKHPIQ